MTAKKDERTRDKRGSDLWLIQPNQFHLIRFPDVDESEVKLNKRIDFSHIPNFAKEIKAHGKIERAVIGYKKDGFFNITDGECRCRAAIYMKEHFEIEIEIPYISESKGTTVEDRLFKQIILNNSGKPFSPVEDAAVIDELINRGVDEKIICQKLNFSKVYICNLKMLQKSPKKIKDLIDKDGLISSTLAMKIFREEKDFDSALAIIEGAIHLKESESGEKKKITDKDIRKLKGKTNSYSALKKVINRATKKQLVVRQDNIQIYEFVQKLNSGDYTVEALLNELFEPEIVEEKKPKKNKNVQMAIE